MICPYCGEGPVWRARVQANGERIAICQECDTVWRKTSGAIEVTNYTNYAESLGLAPLWDGLTLLSAVKDGEEVP